MLTPGVDVSSYQDRFDWAGWKAKGIWFGIAKATEGTTIRDSQFARNWAEMQRLALRRGAYHFAHPSNPAEAEAEAFLAAVNAAGGFSGTDIPALDLEAADGTSPAHCAAWAQQWCQIVQAATGRRPAVYTDIAFIREGRCDGLGAYPLWLADPSAPAGHPRVPAGGPWTTWALHQYGSPNDVDLDVFDGNLAAWDALGGQKEDDMAQVTSLGAAPQQQIAANSDGAISFQKVYSDNHHMFHPDKDGTSYSLIVDATYWAICDALVHLTGFKGGDPVDISWDRMSPPAKAGDPWTVKDNAWKLTYRADPNGVVRVGHGGQFGLDTSVRLRLRVYNPNAYPVAVQGVMAKVALLRY